MKIFTTAVLLITPLIQSSSARRGGGHHGQGHGGGHGHTRGYYGKDGSFESQFVYPGCAAVEKEPVACEMPPRKHRHHHHYHQYGDGDGSEALELRPGIMVCRDIAVRGPWRSGRYGSSSDEDEEVSVEASVCVHPNRTVAEEQCGCCGGTCNFCECSCDLTLGDGTILVGGGVYVMDDNDENYPDGKCVPSGHAITIVELYDGVSCKTECNTVV